MAKVTPGHWRPLPGGGVIRDRTKERQAVEDLIDALHDELSYEVNQSPHVLEHVRKVESMLGGNRYPAEGWW